MENFNGLTNTQIQRGLMHFNGLKQFRRHEDMYYSSNGKYIVLGPTAITITRNLKTGKKPRVEMNWKLFFSSNLKNGVALRKKIFILVSYEIKFETGVTSEHLAVLFIDPQEKVARYIDSWVSSFDELNLNALQPEVPWEYMYGERIINMYSYKYHNGIPNSCTLDCLHSIDRIMHLNSFGKAATEVLFLRRVRRLQNKEINIESTYKTIDRVWYYNGLRYCYDVLLNLQIFKLKKVKN